MRTLQVITPFDDAGELAANFHERVEEGQLMVPAAEGPETGERLNFEIHLADGTVVMYGEATCEASYDNGEEREAVHRYDVVLQSLAMDMVSEAIFERLLLAKRSSFAGEPHTGEIQAAIESVPPMEDDRTQMVSDDSAPRPVSIPPARPSNPSVPTAPLYSDATVASANIVADGFDSAVSEMSYEYDISDAESSAPRMPSVRPPSIRPPSLRPAVAQRQTATVYSGPLSIPKPNTENPGVLLRKPILGESAVKNEPTIELLPNSGLITWTTLPKITQLG